jgi:hypothetical protein
MSRIASKEVSSTLFTACGFAYGNVSRHMGGIRNKCVEPYLSLDVIEGQVPASI